LEQERGVLAQDRILLGQGGGDRGRADQGHGLGGGGGHGLGRESRRDEGAELQRQIGARQVGAVAGLHHRGQAVEIGLGDGQADRGVGGGVERPGLQGRGGVGDEQK